MYSPSRYPLFFLKEAGLAGDVRASVSTLQEKILIQYSGREEMASVCTRDGLDWILGIIFDGKGGQTLE